MNCQTQVFNVYTGIHYRKKIKTSFVLYRTIGIQETNCGHYFIFFLFQSHISFINTFFCVLNVTLIKTKTNQCKTYNTKNSKKKVVQDRISSYKNVFQIWFWIQNIYLFNNYCISRRCIYK